MTVHLPHVTIKTNLTLQVNNESVNCQMLFTPRLAIIVRIIPVRQNKLVRSTQRQSSLGCTATGETGFSLSLVL